jgi:GDPmannose 4,6-dehydratase
MKKVIITGVTGQDGSLMADYLLKNTEHTIVAGVRRLSIKNHNNISHLLDNPRFKLIDLDVADQANTEMVIAEEKPDYFINLAANSFVGVSWKMPVNHMETNAMAVLFQLEAIRKHCPNCRYYNAGSSEEFGDVVEVPQKETHPLRPRSPYGVSKTSARHMVKVWRESYGLYAVQGWLFNHEGVRRGEEFVTRKITKNVARIYNEYKNDHFKPLELGNMDSMRDWSDAEDFVEGIWMMLNQEKYNSALKCRLNKYKAMSTSPIKEEQITAWLSQKIQEYVLSSNETHKIREFVEEAFNFAGFAKDQCRWQGKDLEEKYIHEDKVLVKINPEFYRPAEVEILYGDSSRARNELGWQPKTNFLSLVEKMVRNDLKKD